MSKQVAVLMGGWSSEREVSLVSGAAVSKSLSDAGMTVTSIDVQRNMGALMTRLYPRPDAIFNALHGRFGEDGCVQGVLDILDIPYTHSGLLASALAMDKPMAKRLFTEVGIPVAEHIIATREEIMKGDLLERPYVVKPLNEGSSVGVHIVPEGDNEPLFNDTGWPYGDRVMVEKFISGKELTVAVMGDRALGVTEIKTGREFTITKPSTKTAAPTMWFPLILTPTLPKRPCGFRSWRINRSAVGGCPGPTSVATTRNFIYSKSIPSPA